MVKKVPVQEVPKKTEEKKELNLELPEKKAKKLRRRTSIFYKHKMLLRYFSKAGYDKEFIPKLYKTLFIISTSIILLSLVFLFLIYGNEYGFKYLFAISILLATFGLAIVYFLILGCFYAYLDMKVYWIEQEIEKNLPEFLLLTSSNMRAGMLVDQALLYAARPKFGVLSKEIGYVLKDVLSGKDMTEALTGFSNRYDSILLKRSLHIFIEGIESGGKIAGIINKIAINLSDLALQRKEMSASVTTYAIFISFASIGAAPVLMALSGQLLGVIKGLISTLAESGTEGSGMSFMTFTVPSLTQSQFTIFAVAMLIVSSFFSAILIATIQKGEIKQGLKYIPVFITVSLVIYFISKIVMGILLGSMMAV